MLRASEIIFLCPIPRGQATEPVVFVYLCMQMSKVTIKEKERMHLRGKHVMHWREETKGVKDENILILENKIK